MDNLPTQTSSSTFGRFVAERRCHSRKYRALLPIIFIGGLTGCYNHKFQASCPPAMVERVKPTSSHVDVGVIEFDDMGELFDRCNLSPQDTQPCQLTSVLDWIGKQRAAAANEAVPKDSVVVTFVHGWSNNADPSNDDLNQFNNELDDLQGESSGIKYVGVYLGWRGSSLPGRSTIEYFSSVFNREAGARRVASVSATEVLYRVRDASKKDVAEKDGEKLNGKFILIGHSFGGLIVERTLAQALTARIVLQTDKDPTQHRCEGGSGGAEPFADLTVLVNPAIDAIETQELIDMMKRSQFKTCSANSQYEPPLLVSIKARNDSATGWIFTGAHFLESVDKAFRDYGSAPALGSPDDPKRPSQRSVYEHTAGALDYFQNYCFVGDDEDPGDKGCQLVVKSVRSETVGKNQTGGNASENPGLVRPKITSARYRQAFAGILSEKFGQVVPQLYTRYREPCTYSSCDVWNNTPYWIFTVPPSIVNGHGGLYNSQFASLLRGIILATAINTPKRVEFK